MYDRLPNAAVVKRPVSDSPFEIPKSSTLTCCRELMRMFFGLRSAWTSDLELAPLDFCGEAVRLFQERGHVGSDVHCVLVREPSGNQLGQVVAVHVLHLDEEAPAGLANREDLRHVAVDDAQLPLQLRAHALGLDDGPRLLVIVDADQLEGDFAPIGRVGQVHLAHAAAPESAPQAIPGELPVVVDHHCWGTGAVRWLAAGRRCAAARGAG